MKPGLTGSYITNNNFLYSKATNEYLDCSLVGSIQDSIGREALMQRLRAISDNAESLPEMFNDIGLIYWV